LDANTTGSGGVAIGYMALGKNTTASSNTAMGRYALAENTTGTGNVAIGAYALDANNVGVRNTSLGYGSLSNAVDSGSGTPNDNSAFGYDALNDVTHGYQNVAVGSYAGDNLTSGFSNVYIGDNAGNTHATGDKCIYVGRASNCSATGVDLEYVFGTGIAGKGTQTCYLGGNSGTYNEYNTSSFQTTSDVRIKKNITNNTTGLDKINQITVRNFEYKTEDEIKTDSPELAEHSDAAFVNKEGLQVGSIAQEIEKVLPEVVRTNEYGIKSVNESPLTWYMINAIKELSTENTALKARLDAAGL